MQFQADPSSSLVERFSVMPTGTGSLDGLDDRDIPLTDCNEKGLRQLQTLEFQNTVGGWIENNTPETGFSFTNTYENVCRSDRIAALSSLEHCGQIYEEIQTFITPGTVICYPTTPVVAPLKGTLNIQESVVDFYDRTTGISAFRVSDVCQKSLHRC